MQIFASCKLGCAVLFAGILLGLGPSDLALAQRLPGSEPTRPTKKPEGRRAVKRPEPRPTRGTVIIVTSPGATVSINGSRVGVAAKNGRFEKELSTGEHSITVAAGDEYLPFTTRVALRPGAREVIDAELLPSSGSVEISVPSLNGSTLLINKRPAATLSVDENGRVKIKMAEGDQNEGKTVSVSFNDAQETLTVSGLSPGPHVFTYENPEYTTVERSVTINPGSKQLLSIRSERVAAELTVATEPGTSVYLDGALLGETQGDGVLRRSVAAGQHSIRLSKRGFQTVEDRRIFEPGKPVRIERRLVPSLTRVGFSDDFEIGLSRWTTPRSGWTLSAGSLIIADSPDLGVPTGVVYGDFIVSFNLKLLNGGGAAWAVRTQDSRNYYLFYLSGRQGKYPGRFITYVVQDGKLDLASPATNPLQVNSEITAGNEYYVEITVQGSAVRTQITPLTTGVVENLGVFEDPNRTFSYGSFGFRTVADERFAVDSFYADPPR